MWNRRGRHRRGSAGVSEEGDVSNTDNTHEDREGLRRPPFLLTGGRNERFLQAGRANNHEYINRRLLMVVRSDMIYKRGIYREKQQ